MGGAIYIGTGRNISITDCAFVNNKAVTTLSYRYAGGALYAVSGRAVVVHNSTFINTTHTLLMRLKLLAGKTREPAWLLCPS